MDKSQYKYQDAGKKLMSLIEKMEDGERLPNRSILSNQLQIARTTLEHSIADLIAKGYLISRAGSGTYVRRNGFIHDDILRQLDMLEIDRSHYRKDAWAVLCSSVLNDIYPYIIRAVQDVANQHNASVIVYSTDNKVENEQNYLLKIAQDGVAGVILIPATQGDYNPLFYRTLIKTGMRIVSCYRPIPGFITPGVYCNSFEIGYVATKYLIDIGCKKIAYFSAPMYQTSYDRYQGYLLAMDHNHLTDNGYAVFFDQFNYDPDVSESIILPAFDKHGIPDGIFAFNDRIAKAVYHALKKRNLKPGVDVKVIGCDNSSLSKELEPRLTSVDLPVYTAGQLASEMLMELLQTDNAPLIQHKFCGNCQVIARSSA